MDAGNAMTAYSCSLSCLFLLFTLLLNDALICICGYSFLTAIERSSEDSHRTPLKRPVLHPRELPAAVVLEGIHDEVVRIVPAHAHLGRLAVLRGDLGRQRPRVELASVGINGKPDLGLLERQFDRDGLDLCRHVPVFALVKRERGVRSLHLHVFGKSVEEILEVAPIADRDGFGAPELATAAQCGTGPHDGHGAHGKNGFQLHRPIVAFSKLSATRGRETPDEVAHFNVR